MMGNFKDRSFQAVDCTATDSHLEWIGVCILHSIKRIFFSFCSEHAFILGWCRYRLQLTAAFCSVISSCLLHYCLNLFGRHSSRLLCCWNWLPNDFVNPTRSTISTIDVVVVQSSSIRGLTASLTVFRHCFSLWQTSADSVLLVQSTPWWCHTNLSFVFFNLRQIGHSSSNVFDGTLNPTLPTFVFVCVSDLV